jgi:hypothetical protein
MHLAHLLRVDDFFFAGKMMDFNFIFSGVSTKLAGRSHYFECAANVVGERRHCKGYCHIVLKQQIHHQVVNDIVVAAIHAATVRAFNKAHSFCRRNLGPTDDVLRPSFFLVQVHLYCGIGTFMFYFAAVDAAGR